MTTQLLIYETAVPVSSGRHGKCSVEVNKYGFSCSLNVEFVSRPARRRKILRTRGVPGAETDEAGQIRLVRARRTWSTYALTQGSEAVRSAATARVSNAVVKSASGRTA